MPKYRCIVTGGSDEQASRGPAPETFHDTYGIEAESRADAEAQARRRFERERGEPPPDNPVCERETLLAIREATESELAEPSRAMRLEQAAAKDGATMDEVAAAKRANGHWPD